MRAAASPPPPTWLARFAELRGLVDEVAPAAWSDPRWWALVATIATTETRRAAATYLLSDAGPAGDTFMAWPAPRPVDPIGEAIGLARAARDAVAGLDGALIDQPLAGAIAIGPDGARLVPCALDHVAIAVGTRVALAPLAATDAELARAIAALAGGRMTAPLAAIDRRGPRAFCTISIGDDAWPTAHHGHRRAWVEEPERGGPWLGLARAGDHLIASTCHYAIDGYGHGLLAARIAERSRAPSTSTAPMTLPALAMVPDADPLAFAARAFAPIKAIDLAYRLGIILGDELGVRRGKAPTLQIPVAPGDRDDPERWRRRVLPAVASVRFIDGRPEPFAAFAARARIAIAREAAGVGLASRVLAAGRALPLPVRWKRRVAASPGGSPAWAAPLFDAVAGRGCVSLLRLPPQGERVPPIAASAPARTDAIGSVVVTLVDSGAPSATITVTGTGRWNSAAACARLIDQLAGGTIGSWDTYPTTPGDGS